MLCGHFYLMLTTSVPTSSKAKEPKVGHPKKDDDIFLRIMYEYLGICCNVACTIPEKIGFMKILCSNRTSKKIGTIINLRLSIHKCCISMQVGYNSFYL